MTTTPDPAPGTHPVATIHLPDGTTLTCTVTGRRQAPDRTWWYQLTPTTTPPTRPPAEPPPGNWPPPPTGWRAGPYGPPGTHLVVHRGGCWLPGNIPLTAAEARELITTGDNEACPDCHAEQGLRDTAPPAQQPQRGIPE